MPHAQAASSTADASSSDSARYRLPTFAAPWPSSPTGRHLGPRAGGRGRQIAAIADHDRSDEVLVQMIDELDDAAVRGPRDGNEVEHRQVLDGLAQPDAAGVGADGHAELRGEQEDREVLVDAGHA